MQDCRYTPVDQLGGNFPVWVDLRNVGTQPLDSVQVSIFHEDKEVVSEICSIDTEIKDKRVRMNLALSGLRLGDTLTLTAKAIVLGKQDTTSDNELSVSTILTDTVMAKDCVTDDMYVTTSSIGAKKPIGLGMVYRLNAPDTLTALSLGWAPAAQNQDVFLAIYHWNVEDEAMGDCIWSDTVKRGLESGQRIYYLEKAFLLDTGNYLFEVRQLSEINFGLVVDRIPGGEFYVTTNVPVSKQTNMGYPAYRLIFGRNGFLGGTDVSLHSILTPDQDGVFGSQEAITLKVGNLGYKTEMVPVSVWVDDVFLGHMDVEVAPYSTAQTVFYADLSQVGKIYHILAVCNLDGDENPLNDTCRKEVRCMSVGNECPVAERAIYVYPNPARNQVRVSSKNGVRIQSATLWDMNGTRRQEFLGNVASDEVRLDISGLLPGVYILQVKTPESLYTEKLVVR